MDIDHWSFQPDWYVDGAKKYDWVLTRNRFTRMCDYAHRVTEEDIESLWNLLLVTKKERAVHQFLAQRPHLVVNAEMAHGCRWVKSNPELGNELRPDFMIARLDSGGLRWTLMELQDPDTDLFLTDGKPGEELREGLYQISQWRGWINRWGTNSAPNFGYPDLRADFRAVVVIGRSEDKRQDLHGNRRIAELELEHRVEIRSYDYVGRAAFEALHDCGVDHGPHGA